MALVDIEQGSQIAQDELMPGEERKMPPHTNIFGHRSDNQRRRIIANPKNLLSQSIESETVLQEDVFDEGDDVINR